VLTLGRAPQGGDTEPVLARIEAQIRIHRQQNREGMGMLARGMLVLRSAVVLLPVAIAQHMVLLKGEPASTSMAMCVLAYVYYYFFDYASTMDLSTEQPPNKVRERRGGDAECTHDSCFLLRVASRLLAASMLASKSSTKSKWTGIAVICC